MSPDHECGWLVLWARRRGEMRDYEDGLVEGLVIGMALMTVLYVLVEVVRWRWG